jgi:hypothetical protein
MTSYEFAVPIPSLDEESTINKVIHDFKIALPSARIYVYNNGFFRNRRWVLEKVSEQKSFSYYD